jgi:hypothetical protein
VPLRAISLLPNSNIFRRNVDSFDGWDVCESGGERAVQAVRAGGELVAEQTSGRRIHKLDRRNGAVRDPAEVKGYSERARKPELRRSAWWSWEDSNQQTNGYEQLRGTCRVSKPEHLLLTRPRDRCIEKASDTDSAWQPTLDGGLDEAWREKGQRNGHVDVPLATGLACGDAVDCSATALDA